MLPTLAVVNTNWPLELVVQRMKQPLTSGGEDHATPHAVVMPSELDAAGPNTLSTARRVRSSLDGIRCV